MLKNVFKIVQNQLWKFWAKRVDLVVCSKASIDGADRQPSGLNWSLTMTMLSICVTTAESFYTAGNLMGKIFE